MTLLDSRGLEHSTGSDRVVDRFEAALDMFHSYFGDPIAAIDAVLADHPDFVMGHCLRAGVLLTLIDRNLEPQLRESVLAGERCLKHANDREKRHLAAARAWLEGDFAGSNALYGKILIDYPRDCFALQVAHLSDLYLGQTSQLRDRVARALWSWDDSVPGYGYVLGMHAFGLEEMGDYARAEERGRQALEINRRDPWAVHAVAHVMEMEGRIVDGVGWLTGRVPDWAPDNGFAFHLWWHLALYELELERYDRVLELYDSRVRPRTSDVPLELLDATALLWRLHLRNVDVGRRWVELAEAWEKRTEDAYYSFNDIHAMMAFVGSGRETAAARLLDSLVRRAAGPGTNGTMTREVGLPVCRAIHAFGRGHHGAVVEDLLQVRQIANRSGGSAAQRDAIQLTLVEASIRMKDAQLVRALAAERTELKPASPYNWAIAALGRAYAGDSVGAAEARDHSSYLLRGARRQLEALADR